MLLWPPLTGTQLSPLAPRSWILPRGHTPGNRHDQRAKPGLRPAAGLRVESPRYSPEHQTEDVQGRRLDDTPLRSGNLDRLLEPSQETEPLSSQLPPQNTGTEMARQDTGHGSPEADRNPQHQRHAKASATAIERPPDVATGARRQGGQKRRYKDTLKKSLKQLQINTATKEDLAWDRPVWRRSVKTGSAIYEATLIITAKAKRAARRSPAPRTNTANSQALPTCLRCQHIFRARIDLVEHLQTQCTNNPKIPTSTSNSANPLSDSPTLTPGINSITPTIIETTSLYSSPVTPTTATTTAFAFTTTTTTTTISDGDSLLNCPQCDRTVTSCTGLVGSFANPSYRDW
ncbi:unnamed protein product [Schistocephalus solidus]|uniref:C2H2-type domain-containing protein n=1 Tax=Schistocephalus solidus TaxID=70667 RepID=A0A183THJ3_SCHSO|nr:unnamed protein product [Schistocephalus solidus]